MLCKFFGKINFKIGAFILVLLQNIFYWTTVFHKNFSIIFKNVLSLKKKNKGEFQVVRSWKFFAYGSGTFNVSTTLLINCYSYDDLKGISNLN